MNASSPICPRIYIFERGICFMAETLEQRRNRRVKARRERIMAFLKDLYVQQFELRDLYLKNEGEQRELAYKAYDRLTAKIGMFKYGVAMADADGKWSSKFKKIYEEVEKEYSKMTEEDI